MVKDSSVRAAESGVAPEQWQQVHFVTPILHTWRAIAVLIAFITYQNMDMVREIYDHRQELNEVLTRPSPAVDLFPVWMVVLGALVIALASIVAYSYVAWKRMSFAVGREAVWFRSGLLMRQQRHARFDRIQAVDITYPFIGRLLGLGQLRIEVAGGAQSHVEIGYLKAEQLEALREQVAVLASGSPGVGYVQGDVREPSVGVEAELGIHSEQEATGGAGMRSVPREERPLYSVSVGTHLLSLLYSAEFIVAGGIVVATLLAALGISAFVGEFFVYEIYAGFIPIALIAVSYVWSQVSKHYGFSAFTTAEGIRIQQGLLDTRSQTIPPQRVHAVEITQPFFWRRHDWYRVRILQAGYVGEANGKNPSDILLTAGSRRDAELALWLVMPDLGVEDPLGLIEAGLKGDRLRQDSYFYPVDQSVRWLDWFSWKRRAFALTPVALVTRDGWLRRRFMVLPLERLQALSVHQGPLQRRVGVSTVHVETVPGQVNTRVYHVNANVTSDFVREVLRLSAMCRHAEAGLSWQERISGELNPFAVPLFGVRHNESHSASAMQLGNQEMKNSEDSNS